MSPWLYVTLIILLTLAPPLIALWADWPRSRTERPTEERETSLSVHDLRRNHQMTELMSEVCFNVTNLEIPPDSPAVGDLLTEGQRCVPLHTPVERKVYEYLLNTGFKLSYFWDAKVWRVHLNATGVNFQADTLDDVVNALFTHLVETGVPSAPSLLTEAGLRFAQSFAIPTATWGGDQIDVTTFGDTAGVFLDES